MSSRTDPVSNEDLMAYVDGQLKPERAAEIASAVAADPSLERRMAAYLDSKAALSGAFDEVLSEPVPDRLRTLVLGDATPPRVVRMDRKRRYPAFYGWPQAMAAGVVLAVGVVIGAYLLPASSPDDVFATGLVTSDRSLARALESTASGALSEVGEYRFKVLQSFRTADDSVCREYQAGDANRGATGVACRTTDGWRVEVQVASDAPEQVSSYRPASGVDAAAIDDVLYRLGALPGFDADAESCLIANGWQLDACATE